MVSLAGDYIGQGTDRHYDTSGTLSISGGLGHVEISVSSGKEWWYLDFAPPSGGHLKSVNIQKPSATPSSPKAHRGCRYLETAAAATPTTGGSR